MDIFNSYRLLKEKDGYSIILYIDDSLTEFAEDIVQSNRESKKSFNTDIRQYLAERFPNIKLLSVKIMYRGVILSFFAFNSLAPGAYALTESVPASVAKKIKDTVHFFKRGDKPILISKLHKAKLNPIKKVYYIVKPGDTLSSIAKNNNTTVETIKNMNNLTSDKLYANQLIMLPGSRDSAAIESGAVNPFTALVELHKNLSATPVVYNVSSNNTSQWLPATNEQIEFYINPDNFINDPYGKYQFLVLNYTSGITASDLNSILAGKGVLEGKGAVFLQAAVTYDVSPIYLVSHALLETGNGSTALAKGITVSTVDGVSVTPKVVYNMFGIGAYDINPDKYGSQYAYKQNWFSVDAAINGGAKWISAQYINNIHYRQNTLYKMRWNPSSPGTHQYSTDVAWAYNQTYNIKRLVDKLSNANLVFDIPKY
nr:LysM peptidoglycan-binding domain-containing protein [Clostridium thermarum]